MGAGHERAQSAISHDGTLVIAVDLPAPMRTWYEIWDGQPTLWVRRDLLADLVKIVEAHARTAVPVPPRGVTFHLGVVRHTMRSSTGTATNGADPGGRRVMRT